MVHLTSSMAMKSNHPLNEWPRRARRGFPMRPYPLGKSGAVHAYPAPQTRAHIAPKLEGWGLKGVSLYTDKRRASTRGQREGPFARNANWERQRLYSRKYRAKKQLESMKKL